MGRGDDEEREGRRELRVSIGSVERGMMKTGEGEGRRWSLGKAVRGMMKIG